MLLIAAIGIVGFLLTSSAAPFKDKLFATLYPKRASQAASGSISGPIPPDVIAPSVNIINPVNGSNVRKNRAVNITASASDNVAVARVEFYVADDLRCFDAAPPYTCSWNVPQKPRISYTITAQAYDSAGNSASSSVTVTSR